MGRVIAIGDIHGCSAALRGILREINPQADDILVPLGDYVDRGPDTAGVIAELIALQSRCQVKPLLGNHEAMMLMAVDDPAERGFWLSCGGKQAVQSYGGAIEDIPDAHLEFLRGCQLYFETDRHFFVHANYTPSLPLEKQTDYVLLWEHLTTHMPERHVSGKQAIVGHTPQRDGELFLKDYLICIDTFCYGGGWLTALDVVAQTVWQVDREGNRK